jgi:hypothetical protein
MEFTTVTPPSREVAAERWAAAFAEGWRAPTDADAFADHFEPWLHPDVRLVQPQVPPIVGHDAFRERFARPFFELLRDVEGTVEGWASRGDTLYIGLRIRGTVGRRRVTLRTCDRVTLRDGLAIERVAHVDPLPLLAAIALSPRLWPRFVRQQLRNLRQERESR